MPKSCPSSFASTLKQKLTFLDPNMSHRSRTQTFGTWPGIFLGLATTVFLLLLLLTKLLPVLNYELITVQGYQMALKQNLTIVMEEDIFWLAVQVEINGEAIEAKDAGQYGLNVTFCYVVARRWADLCYEMVPARGRDEDEVYDFVIPRELGNFTIQMFYDWYIGVSKCSKRNSTQCNQSYQVKQITLILSYIKYTYNVFDKEVHQNGGDMVQISVHRNLSSQKCKYINIFYQNINITTDYSIFPAFFPSSFQTITKAQISQYETIVSQEIEQGLATSACGIYLRAPNYAAVIVSRSANNWIYERSFRRVDAVFGEIFGLSAVLMLVWRVGVSGYNGWSKDQGYLRDVYRNVGEKDGDQSKEDSNQKKEKDRTYDGGFVAFFKRPFRSKEAKQKQKKLLQIIEQNTDPAIITIKNAKLQQKIDELQRKYQLLLSQFNQFKAMISVDGLKIHNNDQTKNNKEQGGQNNCERVSIHPNTTQIMNLLESNGNNDKKMEEKEQSQQSMITEQLLNKQSG